MEQAEPAEPETAIDARAVVLGVETHPLPYFTLTLEVPPVYAGTAAGQFVMVQVEDRLEPYLRRAFSVFDVTTSAGAVRVELLGKVIGRGTALLARQAPGNELPLLGPLGRPFRLLDQGRAALVAGGVGSAALLLLARALLSHGCRFDVYYGGRSAVDLALADRFAGLAEESGGELVAVTEDGSRGRRGLVTGPLEDALQSGRVDFVYTCGPVPMMAAVAALCAAYAVAGQAALETPMGCGYGACLGCAVPHASGRWALCCQDGPAFAFDEVRWGERM